MAVEHPDDLHVGGSRCPDAETLAAYLDGTLDAASRDAVESHLADCAHCRAALAETMTFLAEDAGAHADAPVHTRVVRPLRWRAALGTALAAAAALLIVARIAPQWLPWGGPDGDRPELQELIAAVAKEPTRPVEGRLTGGFAYAPPPVVTRGGPTREISPDVRIAAAKIQQTYSTGPDRGTHLLGTARLVVGDADGAVAQLEAASARAPGDPQVQSDLAAAYLALGDATNRAELFVRARDAAERALKVRPGLPEAAFNRALALHRLRDPGAADAWRAVLAAETDPGWRAEAQRHASGG